MNWQKTAHWIYLSGAAGTLFSVFKKENIKLDSNMKEIPVIMKNSIFDQ